MFSPHLDQMVMLNKTFLLLSIVHEYRKIFPHPWPLLGPPTRQLSADSVCYHPHLMHLFFHSYMAYHSPKAAGENRDILSILHVLAAT
jgi:hypothetical protein